MRTSVSRKIFQPGHMTQIMAEAGCQMTYHDPADLLSEYDALLLATGATKPFDPTSRCPGRDLAGIHYAMDFLTRNTKGLLDSGLRNASLHLRGRQKRDCGSEVAIPEQIASVRPCVTAVRAC